MRIFVSDQWVGFSIRSDGADAQAVFDAPEELLPFLGDAVEAWHARLIPYAHRGEVNWRGTVMSGTSMSVADADPGGPLVILTSAGYDNPGPEDLPRIREFWRGVNDVVGFYSGLPGNIRRGVFSGAKVDGHDGATVSPWTDDPSMLGAANQDLTANNWTSTGRPASLTEARSPAPACSRAGAPGTASIRYR